MFVLFDALPLQTESSRSRGIGRYCANLLAGLRAARPHWNLRVLVHDYLPEPTSAVLGRLPVEKFRPLLPVRRETRTANELHFADAIAEMKPDWVLHPSVFECDGLVPQYGSSRPRVASVLYDLIPLRFPHAYNLASSDAVGYGRSFRAARSSDLLLAISEATAADGRDLLGPGAPPVVNIRGAADPSHEPLPPDQFAAAVPAVRAKYGLKRPFVLYVGGYDPRKNLPGAIAAFAAIPEAVRANLDLVIACKMLASEREHLETVAREHGVAGRAIVTGFVSDADLRVMYQACRVFFFPSYYEGLGLPIVEAMRYGAPVVAGDNSSLPEYAGPLSRYCDPSSPQSMADALQAALAEPYEDRAEDRIAFAGQFTWSDTAERTVLALERATRAPAVPLAPRKPRLAWVAPVPPAETGIADYALEVATVLADRYEIEWVADPAGPAPSAAVARQFRVVVGKEFESRHATRPFDLPVYHLGNNTFHRYMLPLMRRVPGLVVLHDAHLGGLFRSANRAGVWPGSLVEELEYVGEPLLAEWAGNGYVHPDTVPTLSPVNRRALEALPGIVVHSRTAWRQVRATCDAAASVVPLLAEVPATPFDMASERRRLNLPSDAFLIATLGIVSPTKRVDVILRAAAALPPGLRERARIVVAGPCEPDIRARLDATAATVGFENRIDYRGRVPLADMPAYAAAADACVQLRFPSNGETSAALARALAGGAACIVSDVGSMSELPAHAALKVRTPVRDVEDLTAALARIATEPELAPRLRRAAREHVARHCNRNAVAAGYAAAISSTIHAIAAGGGQWLNAATTALADAGSVDANAMANWCRLRARTRSAEIVAPEPLRRAA